MRRRRVLGRMLRDLYRKLRGRRGMGRGEARRAVRNLRRRLEECGFSCRAVPLLD